MTSHALANKVVPIHPETSSVDYYGSLVLAQLIGIGDNGFLTVQCADGRELDCECLASAIAERPLEVGDRVIVLCLPGGRVGVVFGRVGPYRAPSATTRACVTVEATETLSLKCGESA